MQPKSHHRAHYETEGSRGAVKAPSGGHPVVQVRHQQLFTEFYWYDFLQKLRFTRHKVSFVPLSCGIICCHYRTSANKQTSACWLTAPFSSWQPAKRMFGRCWFYGRMFSQSKVSTAIKSSLSSLVLFYFLNVLICHSRWILRWDLNDYNELILNYVIHFKISACFLIY